MTFECQCCGQLHDELPQYFEWQKPYDYFILSFWGKRKFVFDNDYMCRIGDKKHFIKCELETPIVGLDEKTLGFITWVGVSEHNYDWYLNYRQNEDDKDEIKELLPGYLCGLIPQHDEALWSEIWFKVIKGDPIPFIHVTDNQNPLFDLANNGATQDYWHEVVKQLRPDVLGN